MSVEGLTPIELPRFRGLHTAAVAVQKTPFGYSPALRNVTFDDGRVSKRPGLASAGSVLGVIRSLSEYVTGSNDRRVTMLTSSPIDIWKETGAYSFSSLSSELAEESVGSNIKMNATNLFGKHYMAFGTNGYTGTVRPRQYDDTNLDPVSQVGPGAACAVAGGAAGNVSVGTHLFRVFFKTRTGYWTAPSPSVSLTISTSAKQVDVTSLPLGPANVVGRVICATAAGGTNYFFVEGSTMVVNDNTTTTATLDFTDTQLIAGTPASSTTDPDEDLLRQVELPVQAWVGAYHNRLAWMGGRNVYLRNGDIGPLNTSFDGGFSGTTPLGWTEKTAGGSKQSPSGANLDVLRLAGNGTTQQGCYENTPNASEYLDAGVKIHARVRMKKGASATGTVIVYFGLSGDAAGTFPTDRLVINLTSVSSSEWTIIDDVMLNAANNKPTSSWRLRVSGGDGVVGAVLGSGHTVDIDWIELYRADLPLDNTLIRWSKPEDPEAYDGLTGFMQVGLNDGERMTCGFTLRDAGGLNARDYFYIVKERSIYATYDDGTKEPNNWPVFQCSSTVGTPSSRGVGVGDGWAVVAARAGLFLFNGVSISERLSKNIQHTWETINWAAGWLIWAIVDAESRRILIGVPADGATAVNKIFVLEYDGSSPTADDDWNIWETSLTGITGTITTSCFSERSDGTRVLLVGGGSSGTNTVYRFNSTSYRDGPSTAISAYYQTHYFDMGPTRELISKIVANVGGSGTLSVDAYLPDEAPSALAAITLAGGHNVYDHERRVDLTKERLAFRFTNAADNEWFALTNLIVWGMRSPYRQVKGIRT